MMQSTTLEKMIRELFNEVWNQQKAELADKLFAADALIHFSADQATNIEQFKALLPDWYQAFPDMKHTIDDLIATQNKVVTQWHGRGTHKGKFAEIPPTQKSFFYSGITIFRFNEDYKIAEAWVYSDLSDGIKKLGE